MQSELSLALRGVLVRSCIAAALLLAACDDDSEGAGNGDTGNEDATPGGDAATGQDAAGDSGGTPDEGGTPDIRPDLEQHSLQFGPVAAEPFEENTMCQVVRLGNESQLHVNQIHNVLGNTSHHFIVYRVNAAEEQPEPFDCFPFVETLNPDAGAPLMITQKADELLTLPQGVAFTLEPNQMIRLELHYVNLSEEPVDVTATTTFIGLPPDEFENEADFLFIGNPDIDIDPDSTHTLGPTYFPLPRDLSGVNFFGITGHTHQYGTNVWVATAPSRSGEDTPVYDVPDWEWDEPETVYHDPPFVIPQDGGFRFTCEWDNYSDRSVGFGESADSEMCFFWAYYYPSRGAKVCFHTDQIGSTDFCCPDNVLCGAIGGF